MTRRASGERYWPWWRQAKDVIATLLGSAIVISMIIRDHYPPLGVALAGVCIGVLASSAVTSWLLGRLDGGSSK